MPKNWCFWIVVLGKTLESPLDCKEIKPLNPNGNQPWICIERTDAEAKALILWPPNVQSWDPDAEKDWGQEEKSVTEDEMVGWHHWLNGREFEQTQGDSEGKPGVLQSMGSQWVRHDLATNNRCANELQKDILKWLYVIFYIFKNVYKIEDHSK